MELRATALSDTDATLGELQPRGEDAEEAVRIARRVLGASHPLAGELETTQDANSACSGGRIAITTAAIKHTTKMPRLRHPVGSGGGGG